MTKLNLFRYWSLWTHTIYPFNVSSFGLSTLDDCWLNYQWQLKNWRHHKSSCSTIEHTVPVPLFQLKIPNYLNGDAILSTAIVFLRRSFRHPMMLFYLRFMMVWEVWAPQFHEIFVTCRLYIDLDVMYACSSQNVSLPVPWIIYNYIKNDGK